MNLYTYNIILVRRDGSSSILGTVQQTADTQHEDLSAVAVQSASAEFSPAALPGFVLWRSHMIPATDIQSVQAELAEVRLL